MDLIYKLESKKVSYQNKVYNKVGKIALWDNRLARTRDSTSLQNGIQVIAPSIGLPALVPGAQVHLDLLPANYMDRTWLSDYQPSFDLPLRRVQLANVSVYAPSRHHTDDILTKRWGPTWFKPLLAMSETLICDSPAMSQGAYESSYDEEPGPARKELLLVVI